jgi:hypothetical protein
MSAVDHSREAAWDIGEAMSDRAFNEAMAHAVMLSGMYCARRSTSTQQRYTI